MRTSLLFLSFIPICFAQSLSSDNYLPHDVSAGFRYEVKVGQNSYFLDNAPGYDLRYSYSPARWLELEAGLEQIVHPIGDSVCCQFIRNANDQLFLVPIGARFVWEPSEGRVRLSVGGGAAYLKHDIGNELPSGGLEGASGWGGQFVASGDYALTQSGRFRAGFTGRYYYVGVGQNRTARIFTVGPDFIFSFR